MSTRTYALGLIVSFALLCLCTALANVVIDPQNMFRLGIVETHSSPNERYRRFLAYERDARQVDGLLFATSRGNAFDTATIAKLAGLHTVASVAVPAGAMSDHMPFLQHVLRDKAARGERVRAALLLLDADFFGTRPWTNLNLDSFLAPEVSGESRLRFWLRYLLAVQFKGWRESLAASGYIARPQVTEALPHARIRLASLEERAERRSDAIRPDVDTMATRGEPSALRLERIARSRKPFLDAHLAELDRFIRLCRENGIVLTIAINPLTRANAVGYEPGRLEETIARINQVTDLWDFSAPAWLADDRSHWIDASHFKPEIAELMLRRMFSTSEAAPPSDFGRFRAKAATLEQ